MRKNHNLKSYPLRMIRLTSSLFLNYELPCQANTNRLKLVEIYTAW